MNSTQLRFSRRKVLTQCVGMASFASAASPWHLLLASPSSRWFKIGACDGCLGKSSDPTALDVAREIGLDGVQVDMGSVKNDMRLRRPEVQQAYRDAMKRTGLEVPSLMIGEMNAVPLKSDPRAAQWLVDSIDVCQALKAEVVLAACFFAGDIDFRRTAEIDQVVKVLKDVAPKAEKAGVTIGMENYMSAEDNIRLIDRVGSSAVKVYYDVGNSTDKGRNVAKEIRQLGKLICELHAKDGKYLLGQGRIDFREVRRALDDVEYSGWIQLESVHPNGVIADYTAQGRFLKGLFPAKGD